MNITTAVVGLCRSLFGLSPLNSSSTVSLTGNLSVSGTISGSGVLLPPLCMGRLTTESGVAVSTSDRTSQGTLYWTPYQGNMVGLYDGSAWGLHSFSERSLALTLTSGKNYDVFVYNNSGTLTLELSAAWTNDTTRADALTLQDGVYVKSGATTRRYLGTIRASGSNVTEDSFGGASQAGGKRYVWNYYHRVPRALGVIDTTNTWTYSTASWQQANAASGNKVEYVCGLALDMVRAHVHHFASSSDVNHNVSAGVGIDSTTVNSAQIRGATAQLNGFPVLADYAGIPVLGYHALNWLEMGHGSGTQTWYGDAGVAAGHYQTGMVAEVWG